MDIHQIIADLKAKSLAEYSSLCEFCEMENDFSGEWITETRFEGYMDCLRDIAEAIKAKEL